MGNSGRAVNSLENSFRAGEPGAVEKVRHRVSRIVTFRGFGISAADRADLEQEAMAQIWTAARSRDFTGGRGFWGFVEVVATRRCIDWLRRSGRMLSLESAREPLDPRQGPLEHAVEREDRRMAQMTLGRLEAPCRELIRMRVEDGYSYREIAQLLDRSETALRAQMYRCVQRARALFQELRAGRHEDGDGS